MYIGLDEDNNRITADEAIKGNMYRCPICEEQLELRQGERRMHHFAHWKGLSCTDTWSSDMSEWHLGWQEKFPKECREVVVECNGKKHRADVLIEKSKLVIEFQHSSLTAKEYQERNEFYSKCGYHVVWLFDMSEAFQKENFVLSEEGTYYTWKHAWGTFWNSEFPIVNYSGNIFFKPALESQEKLEIYNPFDVIREEVAVFFENNGIIEKLLYFDSEKKQIVTSRISDKFNFQWSLSTFLMWLTKNYQPYTMYAPSCPKCRKKMSIQKYRGGDFFWGCPNFYDKAINCRERIDIGILRYPITVTWDNKCPFCDTQLSAYTTCVRCEKCGYTITIKEE